MARKLTSVGIGLISVTALLALGASDATGQTSAVPYAPYSDGPGPTFSNETVTKSFRGKYSSIRAVDFQNLKPLKNGRYQAHSGLFRHSEELERIYYLGSPKEASSLVVNSWIDVGGSSSQGGMAQVFRLFGGSLRSIQKITWDTHFQTRQPYFEFDQTNNTLVIRSSHYIPGDAHCCVSAMDVVTFRWDGTAFVMASVQTELSEYGKRQSKQLPQ